MEETGAVRSLARVRFDTLIWLVFAIVLFAISFWMTNVISKVEQTPAQRGLEVNFLGQGTPAHLPIVTFTAKDKGLELAITGIAQNIETVRFGPFPESVESELSCATGNRNFTSSWEPAADDEMGMIDKGHFKTPLEYVVNLGSLRDELGSPSVMLTPNAAHKIAQHLTAADLASSDRFVAKLKPSTYLHDTLTCSLPIDVTHDTFTSRSFDVMVSEGFPEAQEPAQLKEQDVDSYFPSRVSLLNGDAQEIHVTNREKGVTLLASSVLGPYVDDKEQSLRSSATLHFAWESLVATSRRDIYITVIGTLVALGAAALIEACRPYIEILVCVGPKA